MFFSYLNQVKSYRTFSFFRVIKNVKVEASFQPLDKNVLEKYKSGNWSILEFPVLHIFISECNVRQFKFLCFLGTSEMSDVLHWNSLNFPIEIYSNSIEVFLKWQIRKLIFLGCCFRVSFYSKQINSFERGVK